MISFHNLSDGQEDIFIITINSSTHTISILVDGGNSGVRCMNKIDDIDISRIDYIVLTHIDSDHIQGLLKLLKTNEKCKDSIIVYNKFVNGLISYNQAEKFEKLISDCEVIVSYKEYQNNSGDIIFLSVNQRSKLQKKDDVIYITFLQPTKNKVEKLYDYYKYDKANNKKKTDDAKIVNESSIMFILEYQNFAILMTGDGYIKDIIPYIEMLSNKKTTACPIENFNLIKLPHHGSAENNKELEELLKKINCDIFFLSNSDKSNVKIGNNIATILKDKGVYVSTNSDKYNELNVEIRDVIEIG